MIFIFTPVFIIICEHVYILEWRESFTFWVPVATWQV